MLNVKNCIDTVANTGFGDCPIDLSSVSSYILTKNRLKIPEASLVSKEATKAYLVGLTLANKATRIYPINGITGVEGGAEDALIETFGNGRKKLIRDGNYDFTFRLSEGALCVSNSLRQWNATYPEVLFIDAAGTLIGQTVGKELHSIPLDYFYQKPFDVNDAAGKSSGYFSVVNFQAKYINENIGTIDGGDILFWDLQGLQNVTLSTTTGNAEPILKIVASTGCNGESLFEQFPIQFANIANWLFKNADTGAPITVTSIVIVGKVATITLSTADVDYPIGVGRISGSFASPSILDLAGVSGFESNELIIPTA